MTSCGKKKNSVENLGLLGGVGAKEVEKVVPINNKSAAMVWEVQAREKRSGAGRH